MYGNGAVIGMTAIIIAIVRKPTRKDLHQARTALIVVAVGATTLTTVALPVVTTTTLRTVATASALALCE